jgi:hypothetical protein
MFLHRRLKMVVLCEKCFPEWKNKEVYTIVPLSPCMECGKRDDRKGDSGLIVNAFPIDPRKKET